MKQICIYSFLGLMLLSTFVSAQQYVISPRAKITATTLSPSREHSSSAISLSGGVHAFVTGTTSVAWEDDMFDNQDDPAYSKYKEGYNYILQEKWKEAKDKFSTVISSYPKSEYHDDAKYWSAYALKHIDKKRAIEAYRKFIEDYPNSSYYDDAVADVDKLGASIIWINTGDGKTKAYVGHDGYAYSYSKDSALSSTSKPSRVSAREMRKLSSELGRLSVTMPTIAGAPLMHMTPFPPSPHMFDDENLDPETRLKLDALYAIGDTKEDEKSFLALKDVALDFKQHERLRFAALDIVSNYKKYDVLSIYTEIAKRDTNQQMQGYAIDYITNETKDKNKSVGTLIDLFNATSKSRTEQRRRLFYAIAEVGNDRAVDFLSSVARTNENYDLRREAVFYLGTIGGEKARAALYDILKGSTK